ncbi:sensor histidine kinase [Paraglaciecola aestuariivivens]
MRQLTLVSFVVVLVPLMLLVGYSQIKLEDIAQIARSEAQNAVTIVRQVSKLESLAVDIERQVRQYQVIQNEALKQLIVKSTQGFKGYQFQVCEQLPNQQHCGSLQERVEWIENFTGKEDDMLMEAQLADFQQNLKDVSEQISARLDSRIQAQQIYVMSVQQTQFWLTAMLLGMCFVLLVVGSKAILKPVSKLEQVIRAISRQDKSLPTISKQGPKELIELEHKLHRLAARLMQLESMRHALLRHASHELKTPLASIKEGCSLLTEQVLGSMNEDQQEVLTLLNSSTDRLNLLIMQLLDYNLLLQQAKPVFSNIDSQPLFEQFITENSLAINRYQHQVDLNIELASIYADEKLFRRILDNLLSNALAHGSKHTPIIIKLYQRDNMQVLDFANHGQHISPAQSEILFQPFHRGEGQRNDRITGSGLGLSIVADCARMMFGQAEFVSVDYAEVCIRVQIPCQEANL